MLHTIRLWLVPQVQFGILVAFACLFQFRIDVIVSSIPIKAKVLVPGLILLDVFFGFSSFSMGPIAHFAHLGGAMVGFIMVYY